MSDEPIFVVGVPRSGTTLLASMLSTHSRLACGPETAYFAELAAGEAELAARERWPERAIDSAASTRLEGESLLERYGVTQDELRGLLATREPAAVGVLEALGELAAERAGKARWIEKSPVHLLYGAQIREWFPRSPIVRIVRDPRDVALSLARVPWGPDDLVGGLLYWRRFHERSREFFDTDGGTHTVRYEELVASPEATLRRVCEFIGEPFEPAMLAGSRSTDSLVRPSESWKENAGGPIDASRAGGWRELPEADRYLADLVAGDLLEELGYPLAGARLDAGWVWLHPATEAAAEDPQLGRYLTDGVRLWPAAAGEVPRAALLVGDPDADDWLGRQSAERLGATLSILRRTAGLRLRGRPVVWSRRVGSAGSRGLAAGFLSIALKALGTHGAASG